MRLDFTISVPRAARVGQPVPITLSLHNPFNHPVEAHFLGRTIAFDIIVTREDGTVVWRRLGDSAVPSILQVRTLAPGETMEWHESWRPSAPGRYRLQGILPSDTVEPLRTAWASCEVKP